MKGGLGNVLGLNYSDFYRYAIAARRELWFESIPEIVWTL